MSYKSLQRMAGCEQCKHRGMGSTAEPDKIKCNIEGKLIRPRAQGDCPHLTIVGLSLSEEAIRSIREAQLKKTGR